MLSMRTVERLRGGIIPLNVELSFFSRRIQSAFVYKHQLCDANSHEYENVDVGRLGVSSIHEYAEIGSITAENPSHAPQCREPKSN